MSLVTILLIGFFALSGVVALVVVAACALSSQTSQALEGGWAEEPADEDGYGYVVEEAV